MNSDSTGYDTRVRHLRWSRYIAWVLLVWAWAPSVVAQQKPDLSQMAIEDLMKIEVTSAAKTEQTLLQIPAAVYVITQEEIRRSGATNIAEVLRLVPGVEVAQVNANAWAISIRGFNSWFANKLLVMIDGRSVYLPTFSGVYWDVQDVVLEDIDRIEVIRGPGAAVWGANAVNGVINIITKTAARTQGGLLSARTGTNERGVGSVRYGAPAGASGSYRLFAAYSDRRNYVDGQGHETHDAWDLLHGGFRTDWELSQRDSLTVEGDLYSGTAAQSLHIFEIIPPLSRVIDGDTGLSGANVLVRWQRTFAPHSRASLQAYYDRTHRANIVFGETQQVFDLDFNCERLIGLRQELVWGFGFRLTNEQSKGSFAISLTPSQNTLRLFSGFVQDQITLVPKRLKLTVGSKFESNNYTGLNVQPTVRLLWTPQRNHSFWAAVSRAERTPSIVEESGRVNIDALEGPNGVPMLFALMGNPSYRPEDMVAYEVGYRSQPAPHAMVDVTGFYNIYHHLAGVVPGTPGIETDPAPVHVLVPLSYNNIFDAKNYGVELFASYAPLQRWKLSAGYTWLRSHLYADAANAAASSVLRPGDNPVHQFQVRSYLSLPHGIELDNFLYYVSGLVASGVPAYARWDVRASWRPRSGLELSVGAQNLLSSRHAESISSTTLQGSSQIPRSVYGRLTWRF